MIKPARFRERRRALEMSQGEMAESLGVSRRQIQRYEHGRSDIPLTVGLALSAREAGLTENGPPAKNRQTAVSRQAKEREKR